MRTLRDIFDAFTGAAENRYSAAIDRFTAPAVMLLVSIGAVLPFALIR